MLKAFLAALPDEPARKAFAQACGTSIGHLRNCIYDPAKALNAETCVLIEATSARQVRRWQLRPTDWYRIWPELIGTEGAPLVDADNHLVIAATGAVGGRGGVAVCALANGVQSTKTTQELRDAA